MILARHQAELIGNTDLLRIHSLSELTGCDIYLKCEFQNPGGSIKDRAALQMVQDAMQKGQLKSGMTIVEGTAGNTGIGLALVAKSYGMQMLAVMPNDQAKEKERVLELYGAKLMTVDPCPFVNPNHFYHRARSQAEQHKDHWWANQFENTSNARAHYLHTGPEIWKQSQGKVDILVSAAGTGGTIAGNSMYLKEQNPDLKVWLVDPDGSGIYHYLKSGEYKNHGSSITEGIGIMRLVENFRQASIDYGINLPDSDLVTIARYVRNKDGIVLGSSSALNVAGALFAALYSGPGKSVVTFACDLGERSASKLYNTAYLQQKGLLDCPKDVTALVEKYRSQKQRDKVVNTGI
ncbi:cysteine synthase A [Lacimicrobium alkaliphilum]|uniref:cysteine synthase n=1 Tax=Lacimicrobium alkaliphilum TaxID=1526571 RepID=A0ABQ1RGA1_9ALTE|nr:cysteine synthase A [Lacimicrobium alkaliphilum]GGD68841.1 cysteine synthase A [Lacimicrobium alkaliphilum]